MKKIFVTGIIVVLLISFVAPVHANIFSDVFDFLFGSFSEEEIELVTLGTGDNSTTIYGNGWKEVCYSDGRVIHIDGIRTYLRWDGVWRPFSEWSTTYTNISGDLIADGGNFKSIFYQHKNRIVTDKFSFSQQPSKVYFLNTENKSQYYSILNPSAASSITIENNKLIYENIYPNVDYEFTYSGTKLKEDIVSHRTSYPNSAYGNSNTYLVFSTKLWEFSGIHKLIDDDGEIIGNKDVKGILKLKNVNEDVLSYLPIGDASSVFVNQTCYNETNGEPYICNQTKTTKVHNRVIKVSGTWYLFSGINYTWVKNTNRTGDIVIDPTWVVGSGGNAWSGNATFDDTVEVQSTGDVELRREVDDYVSHWRMDKGTGNTAYDENETSNNDGSFTDGATGNWTSSSKYGDYALDFDGTDDYVDCGNNPSLNITDAITIEAWIYAGAWQATTPIVYKDYSDNKIPYGLRINAAGSFHWFSYDGGDLFTAIGGSMQINTWNFVTVTFDKSLASENAKAYANGVKVSSDDYTGSLPVNGANVEIGRYGFGNAYFDGTIDDVRIYNRALSNDEINQTMDNEHKTEGNLTSWHDASSNNETYKLSVNFTFPANTNASINLYNNDTGVFIETLATNNNTEQWSKTITSAVQDTKVNVTLYGNVSETPEVHNITYHTQATAGDGGTTPSISNVTNGTVNSTAHWVDWDVNQSCANRVKYSNESDLTPTYWSSWQNATAAPNITLSSLTASTTYYYQVWSYNTTNNSLMDNSTTLSFTMAAVDTTFTVTLPSGYTYAEFEPVNSTAQNVTPNGQSASQEFYNVTHTGSGCNLDIRLQLNATVSDITLKVDDDNTPTGASTIETSLVTIYTGLTPDSHVNVWLWSDFNHAIEQQTNKTLSINVTQS